MVLGLGSEEGEGGEYFKTRYKPTLDERILG